MNNNKFLVQKKNCENDKFNQMQLIDLIRFDQANK